MQGTAVSSMAHGSASPHDRGAEGHVKVLLDGEPFLPAQPQLPRYLHDLAERQFEYERHRGSGKSSGLLTSATGIAAEIPGAAAEILIIAFSSGSEVFLRTLDFSALCQETVDRQRS
jgi:hypothetical protein